MAFRVTCPHMSFGVVVRLEEQGQRQQSEHQKKASRDPEESLCLLSQPPQARFHDSISFTRAWMNLNLPQIR